MNAKLEKQVNEAIEFFQTDIGEANGRRSRGARREREAGRGGPQANRGARRVAARRKTTARSVLLASEKGGLQSIKASARSSRKLNALGIFTLSG